MPAVKRKRLEKQRKIKAEVRQELERERNELIECAKDRARASSIIDEYYREQREQEYEIQRVLYGRMYNQGRSEVTR